MTPTLYYTGATRPQVDRQHLHPVEFYHVPTIKIHYFYPESFDTVKTYLSRDPFTVFFSKHGVRGFHRWLKTLEENVQFHPRLTWAVGQATGGAILTLFRVSCRHPVEQSASGLIHEFRSLKRRPVLLITGKQSRPEFPTWLRRNEWELLQILTYGTKEMKNRQLHNLFQNSPEEYVFFTSPSTVRGFLETFSRTDLKKLQSPLVSIGFRTTAEIAKYGGDVFYEASEPSVTKIIDMLLLELIDQR